MVQAPDNRNSSDSKLQDVEQQLENLNLRGKSQQQKPRLDPQPQRQSPNYNDGAAFAALSTEKKIEAIS